MAKNKIFGRILRSFHVKKMRSLSLLFMFLAGMAYGQTGGTGTWAFLDLDYSARSTALGGDFIAIHDGDINTAVSNPAMIDQRIHQHLTMNQYIHPAGINYGMLAYGRSFESLGTFTAHLRYVAYGRFQRTDLTGQDIGTFTAGDYALGIGYGHQLNPYFSIGGNLNFIFSHYAGYSAFGTGADMAVNFHHEEANLTATLIARNIGYQCKGFTPSNHEPLPVEVLAGVSYKFHHAPFRLSITGKDLTTWDLTYNDPSLQPTIDQLTGDTIPVPRATTVQKIFYHTNFGLEILPGDNFFIRLGFNYERRNGLGIIDRMGIGGFSFGFGLKVKKFAFNYGIAIYSAAGVSNVFGITSNLSEWKRRSD